MTRTTVFAEIVKAERNDDGDLVVVGKATGPDLDLDQQICDPEWLSKAMPNWFSTGGNIREQHSSIAAGVATELTKAEGDAWMVSGTIVDPVSARKVEKGVLKGFSVGIKDPRVITDKAAPGGRIVDGHIVEVSLVDRPCNPTCTLTLAKAAKPGMTVSGAVDTERMLIKVEDLHETTADVEKRTFTQSERDEAADRGQAMPDGSFPIKNVQDLKNAIQAIGRAKDPDKAKAHIKARARALGQTSLIPESWKTASPDAGKTDGQVHDAQEIATIRNGLVALVKAELDEFMAGEDELSDVHELLCSLKMLMCWWENEADEGETTEPYTETGSDSPDVVTVSLATQPDTPKSSDSSDSMSDSLSELVAAEVQKATAAYADELKGVKAELAKVLATPVPGGPAISRSADDETRIAKTVMLTDAARYQRLAASVTDREMASYYRTKAAELTRAASEGAIV